MERSVSSGGICARENFFSACAPPRHPFCARSSWLPFHRLFHLFHSPITDSSGVLERDMDHEGLLTRYIAFVIEGRGESFIDATGSTIVWTPEEKKELKRLEQNARIALRR